MYLEQVKSIENELALTIQKAMADRAYGSGEVIQTLIDKQITPNILS